MNQICNQIVEKFSTEHRMTIHNEVESVQIQGWLSDIIAKLEADTARADVHSRQEAIRRRFDETHANVETKFKGMEEQLERELSSTKAIIDNSIRQNTLEHDKLQNKCDSISTGINDTAIELEVANALSSVLAQVSEMGVMHTMSKIQSDTYTKLVDAENKIVGMQEIMKQHEDDQVEMKAHVEAVVGTFEQAKREEAAQWERSMRESEKFLEQEEEELSTMIVH